MNIRDIINRKEFRDFQSIVILLLLLTVLIIGLATFLSYLYFLAFSYSSQNGTFVDLASFLNQNSSQFVSIFTNTMLTLGLIIFSALSLSSTQDSLKQSKEQQKQFQDEQRVRDIEKRLEFFYIPADDIINLKHRKREQTINGYKRNTDSQFVQGLQYLRKYSYLADKTTYEAYDKYMSTECTKPKSTTCRDKYGDFHYCEYHEYNCHEQWETCPHNFEYCEYHPNHGVIDNSKRKDNTICTSDNAKCIYINDLKKKIVQDIEYYKNELLKLKR